MKTVYMNQIYLKGGSSFVTQNKEDAYKVLDGKVLVYIVPLEKGELGRRQLLCVVNANELIPSFVYKDKDYVQWRFCLVAEEETHIQAMAGMNTKPLKNKFASNHGISNVVHEEFEDVMVDHYQRRLVQEDAFIMRTTKEKEEVKVKTEDLIYSFFSNEERLQSNTGEQLLYNMIAMICLKAKMEIAPYEVVKECCGSDAGAEDIARISGIPCREIILEEDWHRSDAGYLLVFQEESKEPAVCIPKGQHGYTLYRNGQKPVRLTKKLAETCSPRAYMFYKPFQQKEISRKEFFSFCINALNKVDVAVAAILTLCSSLIGLLIPKLNQMLYDEYIPTGQSSMILQIAVIIVSFMMGNVAFSVAMGICKFRVSSRMQYQVQNATYHRIFQLPNSFHRRYESADLAKRIMEAGKAAGDVASLALLVIFGAVTSVFYLWRMFAYSVLLSVASISILLLLSAVVYGVSRSQMKYTKSALEADGKVSSKLFQFLQGIEKIRIAGVEERVVYEYLKPYVKQREAEVKLANTNNIVKILTSVQQYVITVVLYIVTYNSLELSMGVFVAFTSAFGYLSKNVTDLVFALVEYKNTQSTFERIRGIYDEKPENDNTNKMPGELNGNIDVNHVTFAYSKNEPNIFEDFSLKINEGDYVGVVGTSGCGKSTLLKLLLGFEKPVYGKVYYDNQDIFDLNLQELRKKFGVVLQDGELISGSIFENITLTSPDSTMKQVEDVVKKVGLYDDIANMPMGLQTIVSENCNTISGGQKQRILIARALINNPKVIFFDEATSALDNITQSMVCDTLENLEATRLVIAHRLSTIKSCNRIIVLEDGKIVEDGDYETLMGAKGRFYQLASRQIMA